MTGGNRLLDGLPVVTQHALQPYLREEPLDVEQTLISPGRRVEDAYFPTEGMVSLLTVMDDGAAVEAGMVGWEGMLPVCVGLGDGVPSQKAVVQVAGAALAIKAVELQRQMKSHPPLADALLGYAENLFNAVAQTAACNCLHLLQQRCARWLLMAHDRVAGNEISITHDALAKLLGVRRAGVTITAQRLQARGLIECRHGTVVVRDRRGLKAAACECYGATAAYAVTSAR